MAINYNEINIPINAEKRDPFHGRSKSEIGLGLTPNMSYSGLETAILANVRSTIDEGVAYNYSEFASEVKPILANLIKLKPNSSRAVIHFSLGTWTKNSEFISRETATLELRSNKDNVSYNLFVTEPYPNTNFVDSTDDKPNRSTALTSTKVIIRKFKTGGWLVQLKVIDWKVDAIWMNVIESKNIDVQNPMENIYEESEFGRNIEFYCDKSRISTNLEISGASLVARSLTHDVPIKLSPVDPDDYYNTNSTTYSLSNIDVSDKIGTSDLVKDDTIISIPIKTDEESCKKDQPIPLSVNRLNHQIKFRLNGAVHNLQRESWRLAQTDQTNLNSFLDTDPEAVNEYPLSITELSHDINLEIGKAEYKGSMPESGKSGGNGYDEYEIEDGKVNYATIHSSTNGRNDYYGYDTKSKSWLIKSDKSKSIDKSASLSTKSDQLSSLNLVLHGLDHDMKIEAVNKDYRTVRGSATDLNRLWASTARLNAGIKNLTWEVGDSTNMETRRNSYVTGHFNLNTFEKDKYQCMDLTVHGMDHTIKLDFFRITTDILKPPSEIELSRTDRFRPNSGGKDLMGQIEIDTFSGRVQNSKLEVIDGRYSDCTRGLALKIDGNYMPWDQIDNYGEFGSYLPTEPTSDELEEIYPTINGIPFTGDFRYSVYYPENLERDGVKKKHSVRNITIPAFHIGSSLDDAGDHKWETLSTQRISSYTADNQPISRLIEERLLDKDIDVNSGYGLTRLTSINVNQTGTEKEKYSKMVSSLGSDTDSMSVFAFKSILAQSDKSNLSVYATKDDLNLELNKLNSNLNWKESVDTFSEISKSYPNPEDGWTVNVKDTDMTYRYTGDQWIAISANSIPMATQSVPGKMSSNDKKKLDGIETGANNYRLPAATESSLGGVIVGDNINLNSGLISIDKSCVTNALGYTPPVSDTTYEVATSSTDGLMSSNDRIKLDAIEANANNYKLPEATESTLGGIKVGNNINVSSGVISIDKSGVVAALGYTPPETDTTYTEATSSKSGLMSSTDKARLDAIEDNANNYILPQSTKSELGGVIVGSNINVSNGVISINKANVTTALGYTPPTSDTTYNEATVDSSGLMSKEDKIKLDKIADEANKYVLPEATSSVLGGVKIGGNIKVTNGTISIDKASVVAALGYTPSASDTDTTYDEVTEDTAGLMTPADKIKLDTIEEGANKYILPKATSSTLGGIKIGDGLSVNDGTISLTVDNITDVLGYTPQVSNTATVDTSTLDQEIDPSTKIANLLDSMTDDNALISVGVLKAIVKAINYRFEKLENNVGI